MSNASKGRKSKQSRPSGKSKATGQNQNQPYDGAYGNQRMVHALLSLMGKKCEAKVRNGGVYDGIFHTFNPKMDMVLDVVHKRTMSGDSNASTNGVDSFLADNDCPKETELIGSMIFQPEKLVSVSFEDVDMSYAEIEINETNGDTNVARPYMKGEKKLEPWNGGGDSIDDEEGHIGGLEDMAKAGTNGWGADEMFRANEEKYGVKSDYDSSLSNYTMPLEIKDTEADSDRVARATRLAQEIESGCDYKQRIELEVSDGTTEEDKFSAVTRERNRDPRDMRDRDREHRDIRDRDKDRGDLRERERDPISPQGYPSKREYDRFHGPNRSRGRGRDSWDKRSQQGYSNPNMGPSRSMGPGGSSGNSRNQNNPSSQMDSQNQSMMGGKPFRTPSGQSNIPPRFTKTGSGGHSSSMQRDDDRMRQHNDNGMHHSYQQGPKNQRRMIRNNQGSNRSWGPMSPPVSEYPHHSPTSQMHSDPAVISVSPAGSGGPPPSLSRTSSSSSNTSAPAQGYNHRKHSSGQEEPPHQQHARQHSSPTGGPAPNPNPMAARPQGMPPQISNAPSNTSEHPPNPALPIRKALICPRILKREVKVSNASQNQETNTVTLADKEKSKTTQVQQPSPRARARKSPCHTKRNLKFEHIPVTPSQKTGNAASEPHFSPMSSNIQRDIHPSMNGHMVAVNGQDHHQVRPGRLSVNNNYVSRPPHQHVYQQQPKVQYIIVHGPASILPDGTTVIPVQSPHVDDQNASWSSVVSRNAQGQKQPMGPVSAEMSQVPQGQPVTGMSQHSPGPRVPHGVVNVKSTVRYTYTPRGLNNPAISHMPGSYPTPQAMGPQMAGNMGSPRPHMHPMPDQHVQGQMMNRPPPPLQNTMNSPPQQPMQQQQPMPSATVAQGGLRAMKPQPATKMPTAVPSESMRHPTEKSEEENKQIPKNRHETSDPMGSKQIDELKLFGKTFKLKDPKTKDPGTQQSGPGNGSPNMGPANQRPQPGASGPPRPPNMPPQVRGQMFPVPMPQQPIYQQSPTQIYAVPHMDQGPAVQHGMVQTPAQLVNNTVQTTKPMQQQQPPMNPMHQRMQQQIPHQIPMAALNIQHFAGGVAPVGLTQGVSQSPRVLEGVQQGMVRTIPQGEKGVLSPQQKPMTSPKQEMSNYQHPNVHVVTGPTAMQANPPAVNTVSAAVASPIVSTQYPSPITATAQIAQHQRQSPTAAQGTTQAGSAPPNEGKPTPSTPTGSITSPTSTGIKALNPDAPLFTPRTPAKPPVATAPRTPTPQQQMQVFIHPQPQPYQAVPPPQAPNQMAPGYNTGQMKPSHIYTTHGQVQQQMPMEQMQAIQAMAGGQAVYHPQFQQQFILQPQPAAQVVPQQMQQFAYDQSPVYGPGQTAMMPQNARVAIPSAQQQAHIQQYQTEQNTQNTMYVAATPMQAQGGMQANYIQQARPHSAHTPTQAPHVTSASPANPTGQQGQQPVAHSAQGMAQAHGVQQGMWMGMPVPNNGQNFVMVQAGTNPHGMPTNMGQQAYLNPMQAAPMQTTIPITSVTPQQKGQQQAIAAAQMITQQNSRQYPTQYTASPSNQ